MEIIYRQKEWKRMRETCFMKEQRQRLMNGNDTFTTYAGFKWRSLIDG